MFRALHIVDSARVLLALADGDPDPVAMVEVFKGSLATDDRLLGE